ncbi:hypothetical protein JOY40_02665 [Bacillus tropicus]|uniref:hypothetical protein n=1 Tax=Bacillus cereus group TaxID=86661 RepID=UPI0022E79A0F|nr:MULTISPECIES: hypothetical protein [unclassified Bacillus cereus group]MDA1549322.1 hypothetical protein [Bacillus cereus group sp. TH243-3LC]MDA1563574.1 hypothetical protein [Bacillus cereus group sp. TH243-1LC]
MNFFLNRSVSINNPLRIFFLCGSSYKKKATKVELNGSQYEIEDKRKVLQKFLEEAYKDKNFRSIILEDNFMFSNKARRHLNYNHINLKSLKSIELLTSLYSDYVLIVHESFSTAAEIGMFSTSDFINSKLMILTPNEYSVEEDYISGFMKLAYQNKRYPSHNIKTIYYNPGIYNFHVSDQVRKLHTFFIDNEVKGNLAKSLSEYLDELSVENITFGKKQGIHNRFKNFYQIMDSNKINVIFNSNDLIAYLIALFNIDAFRVKFISRVDMSHLKRDSEPNRRKSLFKEGTEIVEKYFKEAIYNTIRTDIPNIESEYGSIENIDSFIKFSINHEVVAFKECISYYLYILYALSYINITDKNTRFSITNNFSPVYEEYKDLVQEVKSTKKLWRRR